MLFTYFSPNIFEFRNWIAVGATTFFQLSTGSAYLELGKLTKLCAVSLSLDTGPMTCCQPLLKPGWTRFISSWLSAPFSVSQRLPVTGSIARPKLFRIPYAKYLLSLSSVLLLSLVDKEEDRKGFPLAAEPFSGFTRNITDVSSGGGPSLKF